MFVFAHYLVREQKNNGLKAPDRDGYIREMFDYDLDMIWEEKDVLLEKMDDLYPIQIDELLRK